jgi:energy-converting hydrogenase Eha subunit H
MTEIITEIEETALNTVAITLTVSEELAGAAATVLNQSAVLAISKLNEMQEGSEWCSLTDVKLLPVEGYSLTMIAKFSTLPTTEGS